MIPRTKILALALLASLPLVGCVQRTISITSEPSGALVHLNDQEVGRTPVKVPFTFYGVYDVRLAKAGFETLNTSRRAEAPLWEYPGADLLAEAFSKENHLLWHFDLAPAQEVDTDLLIDHARQMRARLRKELPAGPPPTKPAP